MEYGIGDNVRMALREDTPQERVNAECRRRGADVFVSRCVEVLNGRDVDDAFLHVLGGPHAAQVLSGAEGGRHGYWPRVWATRGLLYAWDASATDVLIAATDDAAWRVREMTAKVIARHRVGEALNAAAALQHDPVARVRAAAERAVRTLAASRA